MMTEETPAKVMGLLGVSLFSMAFLFAISLTNASFQGTETALPSPFSPDKVVAILNHDPFGPEHILPGLDKVASAYSNFVHQNVTGPAQESFAFMDYNFQQNYAWVMDNSDTQIVAMAGLQSLVPKLPSPQAHPAPGSVAHSTALRATLSGAERVAGAYTMRFSP